MRREPTLPQGFTLVARERVTSTFDIARDLAREGAPDGTMVWALEQTGGRGRRGRGWHSPPGNLYTSTILRPDKPIAEAATLTFVASLAAADTAAATPGVTGDIRVKWPNDALIDGRKFVGILLETEGDALIIGVGINVLHHPEDAERPATSLFDAGAVMPEVSTTLERWSAALAARYSSWKTDGFAPTREAWLARAVGVGGEIVVRAPTWEARGVFAGLDTDGVLLLEPLGGGASRRISAGDVFFPARAEV